MEQLDRLSDCPKDLLGKILSFLPSIDALRTVLYSKKFADKFAGIRRHIRTIDISEERDLKKFKKRKGFRKFVESCLKYPLILPRPYKVKLDLVHRKKCPVGDWWHRHRVMKKVKVLEIRISFRNESKMYVLPADTMLKYVKVMKLDHLEWPVVEDIKLHALKELTISDVNIKPEELSMILKASLSLERLRIVFCDLILSPVITSHTLKSLRIDSCSINKVTLEAKRLEFFSYEGNPKHMGNVVFADTPRLKSVYTSFASFMVDDLAGPGVSAVETLTLSHCRFIEGVLNIITPRLHSFACSPYRDHTAPLLQDGKHRCTIVAPKTCLLSFEEGFTEGIVDYIVKMK